MKRGAKLAAFRGGVSRPDSRVCYNGTGRMEETAVAVKDVAKQVIDSLPEGASMDDIIHALYLRAKFDRGEEEIRQGKGIPHEEAKSSLRKWRE